MPCPHSNAPHATPLNCSQCRMARPTDIRISPDGVLMVDGINKGTLVERNKRRQREEVAALSPAARKKLEEEDQVGDED